MSDTSVCCYVDLPSKAGQLIYLRNYGHKLTTLGIVKATIHTNSV